MSSNMIQIKFIQDENCNPVRYCCVRIRRSCPFCGEDKSFSIDDRYTMKAFFCDRCEARILAPTITELVNIWNGEEKGSRK